MELVPVDHDPFATAQPAAGPQLIPVDHDPFAPPAEMASMPTGVGPLDAAKAFQEQVGRAATFGLQDKVGAAVPAVNAMVADAVNAGASGLGFSPPFTSRENGPGYGDLYSAELKRQRGAGETYAENNPNASKVATGLGSVAAVQPGPLAGGGDLAMQAVRGAPATSMLNPATTSTGTLLGIDAAPAAPTVAGRIWQGIKQGTTVGGLTGFGNSNDESLGGDAVNTGIGAALGGAVGGAIPALAGTVGRPVMDWLGRKFGSGAENQATRQIAGRAQQDTAAGGPTAQDMLDTFNAARDKPQSLLDVGGENVRSLGGKLARAPGESRQTVTGFLNNRDLGAGTRLAGDVNSGISAGGSAIDVADALQEARAQAARPAYQAAGIPADPKDYASAPVVNNPDVTRLLSKSTDVQRAISRAKDLPDYADLPDNSIVLLDKAYKNIGGSANQAKRLGNGEDARDLNSLRVQLKNAITGGDPNHPYQQALDAYSGPSSSIDAVEEGAKILKKAPQTVAADLNGMSASDREFYKLGAADAYKTAIAKTGPAGDESKAIVQSQYARDRIRPLFGSDAEYDKFINAATAEQRMAQTKTQIIGNSPSAARIAEDAGGGGSGTGFLNGLIQTGLHASHANVPGVLYSGASAARSLGSLLRTPGGNPEVNAHMANILKETDPNAREAIISRILRAQNAPALTPPFAVPLEAVAAGYAPLLRSQAPTGLPRVVFPSSNQQQ